MLLMFTIFEGLNIASMEAKAQGATTPVAYVPITLTNSQSSATPKDFQQLLQINWSAYSSYLNSNVSNVRFFNSTSFSTSNELAGWIETNNTTTAKSSNVWVNLSGTIVPANGTATIYMAFLSTSASWDSTYWGLAPQLSKTYGQFNNAMKVFYLYGNFQGSSMLSGWTVSAKAGSFTPTLSSNMLEMMDDAADSATALTYNSSFTTKNVIVEASWEYIGSSGNCADGLGVGIYSSGAESASGGWEPRPSDGYYLFDEYYSNSEPAILYDGSEVSEASVHLPSSGTNYVYSQDIITNSSITMSYIYSTSSLYQIGIYSSLTADVSYSSTISNSYSTFYFGSSTGGQASDIYLCWFHVRAYPPAGVMPSVSFGSVTVVSSANHYQISFVQTTLPSSLKWGIRLNNATKVIWSNTTGKYNNITLLPNGTYDFKVINATGFASSPYEGTVTINGTNVTKTITFIGYKVKVIETGLFAGYKWYLNISAQPGLSMSSGQKFTLTSNNTTFYEPNGSYTFTYQPQNTSFRGGSSSFTVSGASLTINITFTPVLFYLNFTALKKPSPLRWYIKLSNSTKNTIGQGSVYTNSSLVSFRVTNGTYYFNSSALNSSINKPLGWWRLNYSSTIILHNTSSFKGIKIKVNGTKQNLNVTFSKAYNITFQEIGLAINSTWNVTLKDPISGSDYTHEVKIKTNITNTQFTSTQGNWTNGSYSITIQKIVNGGTGIRYINYTLPTSVTVNGTNPVVNINYLTQYYLTTESVPAASGYHAPYSGWLNASTVVNLSATANSSYQFSGFVGYNTSSYTGMGTYSNGQYLAQIKMTNPITEEMTFNFYVVLTFYMENITQGVTWGVKLNNTNGLVQWDNTTGYYAVFAIPQGTYDYIVTGVSATPQSGAVQVSSSTRIVLHYNVKTYQVSFISQGLPANMPFGVTVASPNGILYSYVYPNAVVFMIPNGSYAYSIKSPYGWSSNNPGGNFTVNGKSLTITVIFVQQELFLLKNIKAFVPISLNTTNFSIPAGAQIPIYVNWSKYSQYANANLSNVMVVNSSFSPLYAWVQNNASTTYTNSTIWVKVQQNIPSYSSFLIYLIFMHSNINDLSSIGYWGIASQWTNPYGAYDNIAMVMNPGLLMQIYLNQSSPTSLGVASTTTVSDVSYFQGAYFNGNGYDFYANTSYMITSFEGSTQMVYQDIVGSGGQYDPYSTENNVIMDYQMDDYSPPGTWPVISPNWHISEFYAKAQGFAITTNSNTYFYSLDDDAAYLNVSNYGNYLTNGWTKNGNVISDWAGSSTPLIISSTSIPLGDYRFSDLYWETNGGQAMWQIWSSYPVYYYHPVPLLHLPIISFEQIGSTYVAFQSYGLPANTSWAISIAGKVIQSNSDLIYLYLPYGTYFFSIGSVKNNTFYAGFDNSFFPSPGQGYIVVSTFFTLQAILWEHANIKMYDLIPGQATASFKGSILNVTMPVFVTDINGIPCNASTIATIWSNLQVNYVAKLQSEDFQINWTFSNSGLGMFAVFFSLTKNETLQIKNGTAVISLVAAFKFGAFAALATGVAGTTSFNGINVTTPTSTNGGIPGLGQPPASANLNSISGIISYLGFLSQSEIGRSIYLIAILLAIAYYISMLNSKNEKKGKKK